MQDLTSYGFRYSCEGRNFSFIIEASSEKEALARSKAMATSEFVGALERQDEVCQMDDESATSAAEPCRAADEARS